MQRSQRKRTYTVTVACVMCGTEVGYAIVPALTASVVTLNIAEPGLPPQMVYAEHARCPRCGSRNLCEWDREVNTLPNDSTPYQPDEMPKRGRPSKREAEARKLRETLRRLAGAESAA